MSQARANLVRAIRDAHRSGMSQRQIAQLVNRSQPEVNRLLRFHGSSVRGLALRKARGEVNNILTRAELSNPRVFGSTARGEDQTDSDVDLLVTAVRPLSLMTLARVEHELSAAIGYPVDLVLDDAIRPDLEEDILASAVPL